MQFSHEIRERFPGLSVGIVVVSGIKVEPESQNLAAFTHDLEERIRSTTTAEQLKEDPIMRVYRDFFWRIGIDPTKTRPASEALTRRILLGRSLPLINTAVDAYNVASVESKLPIAAFDMQKIEGRLNMRFGLAGEPFLGIGMKVEMTLSGGEVVIADKKRLVAIYPYRDDDLTKVSPETETVMLISCGVPGIERERLAETAGLAGAYVSRFCGGKAGEVELFP